MKNGWNPSVRERATRDYSQNEDHCIIKYMYISQRTRQFFVLVLICAFKAYALYIGIVQ
jgi:hypothetical protein